MWCRGSRGNSTLFTATTTATAAAAAAAASSTITAATTENQTSNSLDKVRSWHGGKRLHHSRK